MRHRPRLPWRLVIVLVGFTALSLAYAVVSPPFENPDEMSHAEYATFIATQLRIPTVDRDCVRMAFHPPLYHALLAPIARAMGLGPEDVMSGHRLNPEFTTTGVVLLHGYPDEAFPFANVSRFVFLGRLLSIACGLVVLLYTYRLALLLFGDPVVSGAAVTVVAAIPQFEYLSASLNHDALAAACAAIALFHVVRLGDDAELGDALLCGLALGAGALTKSSVVALLVVPALTLLAGRADVRRRLRGVAIAYAVAGCVAGWWYVRNLALYGHAVPTVYLHETTWIGAGFVHHGPVDVAYLSAAADQLFRSFWFLAGLMNVSAPSWMYAAWGAISTIGAFGLLLLFRDRRGRLLAGAFVVVLAAVFEYNAKIYSAQGRYLFIVVPVFGVAIGTVLTAIRSTRRRRVAAGALCVVATMLAALCFVGSFLPTYTRATPQRRPADRETARLYCRNVYTQPFRVTGSRLRGVAFHARRVGTGDYALEIDVQRPGGELLRHTSVVASELPERPADVIARFDPLDTVTGETLLISFLAPSATPVAKPSLGYSTAAGPDPSFTESGHPNRGHILLRAEYD